MLFGKFKHVNVFLLLIISLILSGCEELNSQYDQFIQEQAQESTLESQVIEEESSQIDTTVDVRFVPEFNQVESELLNFDGLTIQNTIFESSQAQIQSQDAFEIKANQFKVFEVDQVAENLESQFGFSENPAAVILLHASITNTSNQPFYFPIEELRLSYRNASMNITPSTALYPSASGNLSQILLQNSGEITAGTMVEGYLVYGIGEEAFETMSEDGSFFLNVVPPRQNVDEIVGLGSNALGDELPLFLPLNEESENEISLNNTYIQDRLTTEWWGTKTLLASETLNQREIDQEVEYVLERVEIADFDPFETYEDAFQNFTYGQVIVSIQYQVNNQSDHAILPVDGTASLVIAGDEIQSDYALINQLYGQILQPGQSMTVIKSFALDKMRYFEAWQESDYYIAINTPIDDSLLLSEESSSEQEGDVAMDNSVESEVEFANQGEEVLNESVAEFISDEIEIVVGNENEDFSQVEDIEGANPELLYVQFLYSPQLVMYVNEDMELVSELADSNEESIDETQESEIDIEE